MSATGPAYYPTNLNPKAPEFLPANQHPILFFMPTRTYHPLLPSPPPPRPYPPFFPHFSVALPPQLPPTSVTPTRAVVLLPVPGDVTESSVRRDMEVFGEVRGVQMERADEGIVTVYFYNLRDSQRALKRIRDRYMHQEHFRFGGLNTAARGLVSGRLVWAHFVFPQITAVPGGNNQGSLVIMNLEPTVSSTTLRHIFQVYGEVKELRETPCKREQRFIEFFDVRDAAKALHDMNGKAIDGKPIVVQFSRPGGLSKKLFLDSRFNKNILFNNRHYQPPPPHHHFRLVTSASQFGRRGAVKAKSFNGGSNHNRKRLKNHTKKNLTGDCFTINEDGRDGRTTVMIKNIPNKYSQKLFLSMLDSHCNECNDMIINEGNSHTPMSSYDFVYLPIDFSNKCNVGYGFVNMTSPEAVCRLYKAFHNQQWGVFKSRKICEVTYARLQGVESLKEHFKNSKLPGTEMEEYMPVIFSPPRDGRLVTEPIPIVDLGTKLMTEDSCHCGDESVSEKTLEGSDGCLGERNENGGVSDVES